MNGFYLERKEPGKNMRRFYKVLVTETLLGEWALIKEWGRIGSPGTVRESCFATLQLAEQAASRLKKSKLRRGYVAPASPKKKAASSNGAFVVGNTLLKNQTLPTIQSCSVAVSSSKLGLAAERFFPSG